MEETFFGDGSKEQVQRRNQKFQRISAKLEAFRRALDFCRAGLSKWSSNDESHSVPMELTNHVDSFIARIEQLDERIKYFVLRLKDVEARSGSVAEYRDEIRREIVGAFSVLATEILQCIKAHKGFLDLEIYKRAKSTISIAVQVSLGIGVVMDVGEVFCPDGYGCLLL
jgi:hypothetical protein